MTRGLCSTVVIGEGDPFLFLGSVLVLGPAVVTLEHEILQQLVQGGCEGRRPGIIKIPNLPN